MTDLSSPVAKKRSDYQAPDFFIDSVNMTFWLSPNATKVKTVTRVRRNGEHQNALALDGIDLKLDSVFVNGEQCQVYELTDTHLTLPTSHNEFELEINTVIDPQGNTSLEGLYLSESTFCTQCEAEGFRKITYFLDRPDVLATYEVTVYADKSQYPQLLSNGNLIASGELENGEHWVTWQDPFKKPCYLFALVAGDFDQVNDSYTTLTGKAVDIQFFVDKGNAARAEHGIASLKKSMLWDEQTFGLEYDLDIYMVVAVDFFNAGAMENKGLNIFNSKCVLADPESATDDDYFTVESIIAHEYFHNWTGNRVTCRDWFQLSLKEGLTVFRDQQFSSDMASPVMNRIQQVKVIRQHQFAEDASPMAHPIRPDEVIEMNNFYTVTVYDKGAEVIRMMHTLLGAEGFRRGMDLYFERHDGCAVTCDDFVAAIADANQFDMSLFKRWYSQSGTPEVTVSEAYDASTERYTLTLNQTTPATADQSTKQALHIPVDFMMLDTSNTPIALDDKGNVSKVLELREAEQSWTFDNIKAKPVVDIFRGFSAPVKVHFEQSLDDIVAIMLHATDDFSRWQATTKLYTNIVLNAVAQNGQFAASEITLLLESLKQVLAQPPTDLELLAEMLTVPSFDTLAQSMSSVQVDILLQCRQTLIDSIADALAQELLTCYQTYVLEPFVYEQQQAAIRRIKNTCLFYLAKQDEHSALLQDQHSASDNMTMTLGVLRAAQRYQGALFTNLMTEFEQKWASDVLVLDKWFVLHATRESDDILSILDKLTEHPQFSWSNPNRVRAVVGAFAMQNPSGFHKADGSGYRYLADTIIKLNEINPQVASRLITPLNQWQQYDASRQKLMKAELKRISEHPNLSANLFEKVSKALEVEESVI